MKGLRMLSFLVALYGLPYSVGQAGRSPARPVVHDVLSQALPGVDGRQLRVSLVEVTYAPGGASSAHSHTCPVIGYVVEGALRSKVQGEPERVYRAGESFYEAPNGVHEVSANASNARPVRFLAYFLCDQDDTLSIRAGGRVNEAAKHT
jgi:quercetin dioxygenase-like cupin family protein